ncbi:hypothetical protein BT96DRAFT_826774, partial [Gymnopus androsaceus JB14]
KLSRGLPRKLLSILTQLRTGHIPLQKHLFNIKCAGTPTCPCCGNHPETIYHYLMECTAHNAARNRLRRTIGHRNFAYATLLTTSETLGELFRYVNDMRRFYHIVRELPSLEEEE